MLNHAVQVNHNYFKIAIFSNSQAVPIKSSQIPSKDMRVQSQDVGVQSQVQVLNFEFSSPQVIGPNSNAEK